MALSNDAIAQNFRLILARIDAARKGAVKPAPSTRLIAVSKMHNADEARVLLDAGHRLFGESRVQESLAKWTALKHDFPDVELHLIGPLQTNKVPEAVALFDVIHSLDRPKLAQALKSECDKTGRSPALFVQVNTGEEPQKAGVPPQEAAGFIATVRELKLNLTGLMCIPPLDDPPAPHFALLAKLAAENGLPNLSMGMSGDFEIATRFGATHVRVGTAIFGARPPTA
jgi:PLP dependent protein